MSSGNRFHWCHQCNEPIFPNGPDPVCPYCDGEFIEELAPEVNHKDFESDEGPPPSPTLSDGLTVANTTLLLAMTNVRCPVCQDEFELGEKAKKMPCRHMYHQHCIQTWLQENKTCPVCRAQLGTVP